MVGMIESLDINVSVGDSQRSINELRECKWIARALLGLFLALSSGAISQACSVSIEVLSDLRHFPWEFNVLRKTACSL